MKTLGTKLDDSIAEQFREFCNNEGKSVSEQLREFINKATNKEISNHIDSIENEIKNCSCCDEDSKKMLLKIVKNIHNNDSLGLDEDDNGRPLEAKIDWVYEDENLSKTQPHPKVVFSD